MNEDFFSCESLNVSMENGRSIGTVYFRPSEITTFSLWKSRSGNEKGVHIRLRGGTQVDLMCDMDTFIKKMGFKSKPLMEEKVPRHQSEPL